MPDTDCDAQLTAMIVDDCSLMRHMLRTILEWNGCTVVAEASDGNEAVSKYAVLRPHITFMDLVMPVKTGIEATREIMSFDETARIVACSSSDELKDAAIESGARAFVAKPYKVEQLHHAIERVMLA